MARTYTSPPVHQCRLNLTEWRAQCGLSIEQIETETKISRRFLRAIEAERFDELPGGIFTVSYLKQYAATIGFDEAALLACYQESRGEEPPAPKPAQSQQRARWLRSAFTLKLF
ncbi:MAG: helix-turn-helix domain-containing protein [Bryobacteraceae bacterium]